MLHTDTKKKSRYIKVALVVLAAVALQAWDLTYNNVETSIDGSYRVDTLFKTPVMRAQKVAVVASDNAQLTSPASVTSTALTFQQIKAMVKKSIDLVGGISTYVKSGDSILIKPNIVGAKATGDGENTDIRVVKAIISIIYDTYGNNCKIFIGEGSARSNATMGGAGWVVAGYSKLSTDADLTGINFQLVDLNDEVAQGVNLVNVNSKASLAYPQGGKYWIHKYLISPNIKYIDVPVLKMHEPGITCVLKNQIGIAAGAKYGWNKMSGGPGGALIHHNQFTAQYNYKSWQDEEIVDLCSCMNHFTLCVVDALMCLETQKTLITGGTNQVRLNTIIAGADPVAVDHVCTQIIGSNPDDVDHIVLAEKIGLGTNNNDSITVVGENIATKYTHQFLRGSAYSQYGKGNRVWLVSPAFTFSTMATDYLGGESQAAPSRGTANWSAPIYFFDDRIDLNSYLKPSGNVVSYCYTNVYSPAARQNVELWLNSEEDMMVYLNGTSVYNYSGTRANANLVTDKPLVNLVAGENRILVKVLQRTGCYDFTLNICEPGSNGNRIKGLKYYIKNYNEPAEVKRINSAVHQPLISDIKLVISGTELKVINAEVNGISIYQMNGVRLLSVNDSEADISALRPGAYIATLRLTNGSVVSSKFIK